MGFPDGDTHGAPRGVRRPLPSFQQWLSSGAGRAEWRLGWYEDDVPPPTDAVDVLEKETGSRKYATFLGVVRPDDLRAGVFTLSFRAQETAGGRVKLTAFEWWAPQTRTRSRAKEWKDSPYVWFAHRRIPPGTRPPFNHNEPRFRMAFAAAIAESGGIEWLNRTSLKPTKLFQGRLRRKYETDD